MTVDFQHRFGPKRKPLYPGYVIAYITHYVAIPEDTEHFSRTEIEELIENLLRAGVDNAMKDLRRAKITVDGKEAVFKDEKKDLPKAAHGVRHSAQRGERAIKENQSCLPPHERI